MDVSALTDRPARLLLRLHLRRSGGLIRLKGPSLDTRLWIRNQVLWGAQGVPKLFGDLADRVPDARALKGDLLADIPVLLAMGIGINEAGDAASAGVGMLLAECTLDPEVQASFEAEANPPPGSFALEGSLLRAFAVALPKLHPAAEVADELAGWSNNRLQVEDAVGEDLGPLGPIAIRTLALARRNRILGDLVRESGRGQLQRTQQAWIAVDLLRQLGLIRIPGAPPSVRHRDGRHPTSLAEHSEDPQSSDSFQPPSSVPSEAPAPPPPEPKPQAPRPPRGSTRRRMPAGLAAFAASAGEQDEHESVEIETSSGGGWSSRLGALDLSGPMTDRIQDETDEDGQTEPLPDMSLEREVSVDFDDPDSIESSELASMTGPMEMGSLEDEDEEEEQEFFGEPEDEEDEEEEQEFFGEEFDDEDSEDMAFGEVYEDDEEDGTDELDSVLEDPDDGSQDLGPLIEGIDDEPSTSASSPLLLGDPRDQPTEEEGGFSFGEVSPEDPALPGLRRRLKQLRAAPPLTALGMNETELLEQLWLRSELGPSWQRARAPWLPENWRSASPSVQAVAGEVLELLDQTHEALQAAPVFAEALGRSWESVPKRKSRTADALVLRAQRLCAGAKWAEALHVLGEARKANASSPQALLLQLFARVVTRAMGVSDAVAWVYAVSQGGKDPRLRAQGAYTAGRLLERSGKTADALACYRAAAKALPAHKPTQARLTHLAESAPGQPSAIGRLFLDAED